MHTWNWQSWEGLPYLTCSLLNPFPHGFFTQHFSPRSPTELVNLIQPGAQVYQVRQVHGDTVLTATEIDAAGNDSAAADAPNLPPADGLLTERAVQAVWVCTADCVPVLVADAKTGQVAAIHAGWRGTAAEIVPRAIARLQKQGSQIQDLLVAMGPAIAGEVYQVSTTVAAQVGATVIKDRATQSTDVEAILSTLQQVPESPLLRDPEPGRVRLDVRRINALQLEQLGLHPEQMAIAPYCTYQHAEHFFSYRRHPLKKVQWSGIVSGERR